MSCDIYFILELLINFIYLFLGCAVVDDCVPCTQEGCFFVVLSNGEICLETVDGVVGVVAVIQPFSPEMCAALSPTTIIPLISTTTTSTTSKTTSAKTTTATTKSTITSSTSTQVTPSDAEVGLAWYWIVVIIMSSFLLFFGVGFALYKRANLRYNRHFDQLHPHDIL